MLNYLSSQASSVLCEHLFSASKQTAVDHCACLNNERFEQLQVLKFAWRTNIPDLAASNKQAHNIIDLSSYEILHYQDLTELNLDNELEDDSNYVFLTDDLLLDDWSAVTHPFHMVVHLSLYTLSYPHLTPLPC